MALTADELLRVMERAKELGVTSLNVEGTSITFNQTEERQPFTPPHTQTYSDKELQRPLEYYDEILSDPELILYAATPMFEQKLFEKRELKKQRELEDKHRQID